MTHRRHPRTSDAPRAARATGCALATVGSRPGDGRPPAHPAHEEPPSPLTATLESVVAIVSIAVVGLVSAAISAAPL